MSRILATRKRVITTSVAVAALGGVGAAVGTGVFASAAVAAPATVNATAAMLTPSATGGAVGIVTAISGSSITIKTLRGVSKTFSITSSTAFVNGPKNTVSASLIQVGDRVAIKPTTKGGTVAATVDKTLVREVGVVTTVAGDTITIKGLDGFTRTIEVSSSTKYFDKKATSSLASVVAGDAVRAAGNVDPNGTTLDAVTVRIGTVAQFKKAAARRLVRRYDRRHGITPPAKTAASPAAAPSAT